MMKKGSIQDVFFMAVFAVLCSIVFVTGWMMMSKVNTELQASDLSTQGKAIIQDSNDNYVNWLDNLFLVVFVMLWVVALILASQIDVHPVFFIFTIVIYAVLVLISAVLGNAFYDFANNAEISTYADAFTIITFVMNNFVAMMVVVGFSIAGVMYGKLR